MLLAVRREPPGVLRGFMNWHRTARAAPLLKSTPFEADPLFESAESSFKLKY